MKKLFTKLRNPKVIKTLIAILLVLIVTITSIFLEKRSGRVFIDDSLVAAPIISVSPTNPGKLTETDVYEDQFVERGDVLAVVGSESLRAETDGLIIMVNDQIGSIASPATPVVQMIQTKDMRIAGTLDENKGLKDIKIGQVASFTVDALPGKTFWGYVDEVSPSAKQTELAFSISSERPTQQFVVYVKYDSAQYPEIKNGMSAKMTVYTQTN